MKVQLLSDLHNEFYRPDMPPNIEHTDADLIVLAGDIDVGMDGLVWACKETERLDKRILYVAGNHEFYHHDLSLLNEMREFAAGSNRLHFLENDELIIGEVRFLGCTLWTDYQAAGDPVLSMMKVQQRLSDHHVVSNGERLFLPEDALKIHTESRKWLEGKLKDSFAGKTVVVSHHAPHLLCKHPSFPMDELATAFLSDLNGLVEIADVWCFGHTHANVDVEVGKCRLVSNQRGYPPENVKEYNPAFVLEV